MVAVFAATVALAGPLLAAPAANAAPTAMVLNVSPSGKATACKPDQPCTIDAAQRKVREVLAEGTDRQVIVELADGVYPRSATLEFDARDSGVEGRPVVWRAAEGANPVLEAGVPVTGWELIDAEAGLWQGSAVDGGEVRQLFVGDDRATRAEGAACSAKDCVVTDDGITGPGVAEMLEWAHPEDLEASIKIRWRNHRCGVAQATADTLVMEQPCWQNASAGTNRTGPAWDTTTVDSSRYNGVAFFTGAAELVDEPGEFAYTEADGTVRYLAREGENPNELTITTPRLETVIRLAGTAEVRVHDLEFEGLAVRHTAYVQPSTTEGYAGMQAGLTLTGESGPVDHAGRYYTKPAAAIVVQAGERVRIDGGDFRSLGGAGVVVEQGTRSSGITGSTFQDLSSGAIYTGDTESNPPAELESRDNTYEYNTVRRSGVEYTDSVAIWGGYEAGTSISHNTLETLPYSGISLGWGWNQKEVRNPFSRDNHIDGNRIIDTMMPWSLQADGGSIYTQAPQPGTTISGNYIHKTTGNGVYLDEQSSFITVSRNVVTGLAPTWLSNWAGYGIKNVANDNWSSAAFRKMNGSGSTQSGNHESLSWLPAEAVEVAAAAGATPPGEVFQLPRLGIAPSAVGAPFTVGKPARITAKITNADPDGPLDSLDAVLETPEGWTVTPDGSTSFTDVPGSGVVTASWTVVPTLPAGVYSRQDSFTVTADYRSGDDTGSLSSTGQVYVSTTNLARGKAATQSSTYVLSSSGQAYPASNAVDGNVSNFAHTAAGDAQPWWQVDLGESVQVDSVALWNRSDCCQERLQGVYVFVSDTPFTSDDPTETAGQEGVWSTFFADRAERPSLVDVGAHGRYVRIQLDSMTDMMNVAEVQVFGG